MLVIFSICHSFNKFCSHDMLMKDTEIKYVGPERERSALIKRYSNWSQIRIKFDFDYLDGTLPDPLMCKQVGQIVKWQGSKYNCTQDHLLTKKKIDAVKGTLENARQFFQNLLSVIPADYPYKLQNWTDHFYSAVDKTVSDVDLYITVVARPNWIETVASCGTHVHRRIDNFPEQAVIFINPILCPDEAQSGETKIQKYYKVMLHEITHALGFTRSQYNRFHSYDSMIPYENTTCRLQKLGKNFAFLVTPFCHRWALKHYGVEKLYGDNGIECLSGIELEDGGDPTGTTGSHLESRVFFSDSMIGNSLEENGYYERYTDATLAVQDTGNFKCNFTLAQPLVWGNPECIDENYIKDFATGPYRRVFPSYYLQDVNRTITTSFDFSYAGRTYFLQEPMNCRTMENYNSKLYCPAKEFYNPDDEGDIGFAVFDFMSFKPPQLVCPYGKALLPTKNHYICGEYECNGYDSFKWRFYNNSNDYKIIEYDKSTIGLNFTLKTGRYESEVFCPDPERFCRSIKLRESFFKEDPFDLNTVVLTDAKRPQVPGSDIEQGENSKKKKIIIGSVIACIVVIIIVVAGVFIYINIRKGTNPGDDPEKGVAI